MTPKEVRELRIKAGLTQKKCAEMFGITLNAWQKKETSYKDSTHNRNISNAEIIVLKRLAKKKFNYE
jgi:transcriptional regulator with XRE-family HTH domain